MNEMEHNGRGLAERAIAYIQQDIEINKELSGIDLSSFLGMVLHVSAFFAFSSSFGIKEKWQYLQDQLIIQDLPTGSSLVSLALYMRKMAKVLELKITDEKAYFPNTPKAITAIGLITRKDYEETASQIIDGFYAKLLSHSKGLSNEVQEMNMQAENFLLDEMKHRVGINPNFAKNGAPFTKPVTLGDII